MSRNDSPLGAVSSWDCSTRAARVHSRFNCAVPRLLECGHCWTAHAHRAPRDVGRRRAASGAPANNQVLASESRMDVETPVLGAFGAIARPSLAPMQNWAENSRFPRQ